MRVLVTGATGYLGRAIVHALRARGHAPVAFARHASTSRLDVPCIDGDVTDAHPVDAAVRDSDAVCHAAALVSIWRRDTSDFDRVNVEGTRLVLSAAQRHGIRRCVYTSSFLAIPPDGATAPLQANDYQRTKAQALAVADAFTAAGLPLVTMIPGVIYGPGVRTEGNLVGRLLIDRVEGRLPAAVGLDRIWSFAYVDDVADAHAAAVDAPQVRPRYGLGGPNLPQRALFEWLQRTSGRSLPRPLPPAMARLAGWIEQQRARLTGAMPLVTVRSVDVLEHDWPIDSRDAVEDLGYRLRPLDEGLDLMWRTLMPPSPVA